MEDTACCVRNGSWLFSFPLTVEKLFSGLGKEKWFSVLGLLFDIQEIVLTSLLDIGEIFLDQYLHCLSRINNSLITISEKMILLSTRNDSHSIIPYNDSFLLLPYHRPENRKSGFYFHSKMPKPKLNKVLYSILSCT